MLKTMMPTFHQSYNQTRNQQPQYQQQPPYQQPQYQYPYHHQQMFAFYTENNFQMLWEILSEEKEILCMEATQEKNTMKDILLKMFHEFWMVNQAKVTMNNNNNGTPSLYLTDKMVLQLNKQFIQSAIKVIKKINKKTKSVTFEHDLEKHKTNFEFYSTKPVPPTPNFQDSSLFQPVSNAATAMAMTMTMTTTTTLTKEEEEKENLSEAMNKLIQERKYDVEPRKEHPKTLTKEREEEEKEIVGVPTGGDSEIVPKFRKKKIEIGQEDVEISTLPSPSISSSSSPSFVNSHSIFQKLHQLPSSSSSSSFLTSSSSDSDSETTNSDSSSLFSPLLSDVSSFTKEEQEEKISSSSSSSSSIYSSFVEMDEKIQHLQSQINALHLILEQVINKK